MISSLYILTLSALIAGASAVALTDLVDVFVGTFGAGYGVSDVPPGPQVPFGAMRLSPDTSAGLEPLRIPFYLDGGYYYGDKFIECFSHTHLDGAGIGDMQNIGVTVTRRLDEDIISNAGYKSTYQHQTEVGSPGYYAVNLDTWGVLAEVTACGTHAGVHRYSCRAREPNVVAEPCFLLVDICHVAARSSDMFDFSKACKSAEIVSVEQIDPTNGSYRVVGRMFNAGQFSSGTQPFGGFEVYFAMEISATDGVTGAPVSSNISYWQDTVVYANAVPRNGTNSTAGSLGVAFATSAPAAGRYVQFTVASAISFVSTTSALNNLAVQLEESRAAPDLFDACRAQAVNQWETVLQGASVGNLESVIATNRDQATVFYTALYHAHLSPTTYSEANGEYLGLDGKVYTALAGTRRVSDLSLWDTYRTHGPLMALIEPAMTRDTVSSMLHMYAETGNTSFPKWPLANVETGCMVGRHGLIIASDAVMKGVPGVDSDAVFDALVATVLNEISGHLSPLGYVAVEDSGGSAAHTMDYALDAGAALHLAAFLNRTVPAIFQPAAAAFINVWHNESQFFCGRFRNGTFDCQFPYLPYPIFETNFVEGNGGQYRWYVPHALDDLVNLFNSRDEFAQQLHQFHADALLWPLNTTLPNAFFWAGNEPTFLTPFLFNVAGNQYAHLTQAWVPLLDDTYFFNGPAGVPGNDDYGAMASWLVFGYLGLYPLASTANYTLFVPRFDNLTLTLSPTRSLQLVSHGRPSIGPVFLANASINGQFLPTPFVTHAHLLQGGAVSRLDFFLTSEPTVFGAPAPSEGGPAPWMPDEADALARRKFVDGIAAMLSDVEMKG
jgi:predicted alpha-1,2-mannosidase